METVRDFISWAPKSLQVVTADMKLKDACSLEEKLRSTFSSVHFSRSVMSDSLRPQELQHTRPPCPRPSWVAPWAWLGFIELDKAVVLV